MPRFKVTVDYTYRKDITLHARDEDEAKEKAVDMVNEWTGVRECEAVEAEEE